MNNTIENFVIAFFITFGLANLVYGWPRWYDNLDQYFVYSTVGIISLGFGILFVILTKKK